MTVRPITMFSSILLTRCRPFGTIAVLMILSPKSSVNSASKDILARLLAGENITVVHDSQATTAMFEPSTRTLILPTWDNMTNEIYDMLVGHEVGHALFTPWNDDNEKSSGAWCIEAEQIAGTAHAATCHGYINIIEDARIERLIKAKFPGLRRDFFMAYEEFAKRDFFGLDQHIKSGKSLKDLPLIDRINIHFKVGTCGDSKMTFNSIEKTFVDRTESATTFDDVVEIVRDLWEYESKQQGNAPEQATQKMPKSVPGAGDGEDDGAGEPSGDPSGDPSNRAGNKTCPTREYTTKAPLPSKTQKKFDEMVEKSFKSDADKVYYQNLPEFNGKATIESCKSIDDMMNAFYQESTPQYKAEIDSLRLKAKETLEDFTKTSRPNISLMNKQFELKKAADASKRNSIRKTGLLDCVRVVNYKTSDDIFRRNMIVKDGKNHGLVMYIDWSGSMSNCLLDTVRQLTQLVFFCKKQNIPFQVYAFSSVMQDNFEMTDTTQRSWVRRDASLDHKTNNPSEYREFMHDFKLFNLISSDLKSNEFKRSLENMYMMAISNSGSSHYYCIPDRLRLASTPLDEAILAACTMVPEFKRNNKLQVVHTIFLTDGETSGGVRQYSKRTPSFFRDKKKHKDYKIIGSSTDTLLRILREKTESNVIGFYIYGGRALRSSDMEKYLRAYYCPETGERKWDNNSVSSLAESKQLKSYKENGFMMVNPKSTGYSAEYIIKSSDMAIDDSNVFDTLGSDATISNIKQAFIQTSHKRMKSRTMLINFIDMISK